MPEFNGFFVFSKAGEKRGALGLDPRPDAESQLSIASWPWSEPAPRESSRAFPRAEASAPLSSGSNLRPLARQEPRLAPSYRAKR